MKLSKNIELFGEKKMKTLKIIKKSVVVLVILLVVVFVGFYLFGEQAIKKGVEIGASNALGVEVSVGNIELSLFKGAVKIEDMIIKNPPDYKYEDFVRLDYCYVNVDIGSLLSDTVIIEKFEVDGLDMVLEQKGLTNNMQEILNALPSTEEQQQQQESGKAGKNLQISELEISNINVKAKLLPIPGKADTVTLSLSPIKMSDLGSDDKMSVGVLTSKILVAIADGVVQQGSGVLPASVTDTMKSTLEKGEKILEKGVDIGTDIAEGLKGLFKPKDKK